MADRDTEKDPTVRTYSGSVAQAAFYYDVIQKLGIAVLRNNFFTEERMTIFKQWRETENGKRWVAWDKIAARPK